MARLNAASQARWSDLLAAMPTDTQTILLCSSRDAGWATVRDSQAQHSHPFQIQPMTVLQYVYHVAQPMLKQTKLRLISPIEQESLIASLWQDLEPDLEAKVKAQLGSGPSLVQGLRATLQEVRMAGVEAANWMSDAFPAKGKGAILQTMLSRYEEALQERSWADPARLCILARDRLMEESLPQILLVPTQLKYAGLVQTVIDQVTAQVPLLTSSDVASTEESGLFDQAVQDYQRLAWLQQPDACPPARRDGTVQLYRALSPEYEVLAVIGTILQQQIPFGQVEVLYSDGDIYPEHFYSILSSRQPVQDTTLPLCFREGVPLRWTAPAKAQLLWYDWVASDFANSALVELVLQDLVNLPEPASRHAVLTVLRELPVISGRDAWKEVCEHYQAESRHSQEHRQACRVLWQLVEALLELSPTDDTSSSDVWKAADIFLRGHVQCKTEWDRRCVNMTRAMIKDYQTAKELSGNDAWERLRRWMLEASLPAEALREGEIALTPLVLGESVRRPYTFMIGMSDDMYPVMPRRESLLSDRERKGLAPELMQQSTRELMHQQEASLLTILRELPGKVILLYSCADQLDDRERFPSQLFLRVFRLQAELPEGDLHELESWLEAPLGPSSPLCRWTEAESWLNHWPEQPFVDALFKADFPLLCRGAYAAKQRHSYQFTEHDGHVTAAGTLFDPVRSQYVYSANTLERFGRCPLQFFYHEVLRLRKPDEQLVEPGRWLSPPVRGELLHAVFHRYHLSLGQEKRKPDNLRDGPLLRAMLAQCIEERQAELPQVPTHVRDAELGELHETLHIFLMEESQSIHAYQPRYLEATLGMASDGTPSEIDTAEPVAIRLPSGRILLMRGRVDRIDAVVPATDETVLQPNYFIWDYKTGKMSEYQSPQARRTGQLLQPLLYLEMAEKRLREVVDANAKVVGAGYFFPGQRGGQGDRLPFTAEVLRQDSQVLDIILDLLQNGIFLATDQEDTCKHCDYQEACDLKDVVKQTKNKQRYAQNTMLVSLRKLRSAT